MSDDPQHRYELVNGGHLFFDANQAPHGKSDLLDGDKTQDALILLLEYLVAGGWHFEITSVNTDHSNDSALGPHCHNPCGFCVDGGLLSGPEPGMYLADNDPDVAQFLFYMAAAPTLNEIGLGGGYYTDANAAACGVFGFQDSASDHIHLGAK